MNIAELFSPVLLQEHIDRGMVAAKQHATEPLTIYNYTVIAQFERAWDKVTTQCRGLIVHTDTGEIVARPFAKFLNFGEHDAATLPLDQPFEVTEKMDGSLGIAYPTANGVAIATRGSFHSDQAKYATTLFRNNYAHVFLLPGVTYLFEIIYPGNRIVVDYGARDELVLLTAIDNETGADVELDQLNWPGPIAPRHHFDSFEAVQKYVNESTDSGSDSEGVVVRFAPHRAGAPSLRVKLKLADYVRLHRILTGVSSINIWEALSSGTGLVAWLENVPDEFYDWVHRVADGLQAQFDQIERACLATMQDPRASMGGAVGDNAARERRDLANFFADKPYRAVLFKMLDQRPYADLIWRELKPEFSLPMRDDPDA